MRKGPFPKKFRQKSNFCCIDDHYKDGWLYIMYDTEAIIEVHVRCVQIQFLTRNSLVAKMLIL